MPIKCLVCEHEIKENFPPVSLAIYSNRKDSDIKTWEELLERNKFYFCSEICFEKFILGHFLRNRPDEMNYLLQVVGVLDTKNIIRQLILSHIRQRKVINFMTRKISLIPKWIIFIFQKTIWR